MNISVSDANAKLDKLSRDPTTLLFALSPEGFLLVKKGKNIEVSNYCLLLNGHYCRRNGLTIDTDMTLNAHGTFLCCYGKEKFIAPISTEGFEYATTKKPLSPDFSLALSMRFAERIILLIADGQFAKQAFLITSTDTPSNELFASSIIKKLAASRNPAIVEKLFEDEEVSSDGQEE